MGAQVEWESLPWAMVAPPPAASPGIISVVFVPSVFILGLRLKGQQLAEEALFLAVLEAQEKTPTCAGTFQVSAFFF